LEIFRIFKNLFGPAAYELENAFSNICGKDSVPGRDLFDRRWLNIQAGGTGNHPEYYKAGIFLTVGAHYRKYNARAAKRNIRPDSIS
jgi:hypothetical protein